MHIRNKEQAGEPFRAPLGELIYELVGNQPSLGGAVNHSLAQVAVPSGKLSPRHYHRVLEETYFLLQGKARMIIDGREFALLPGEACLIRPGEVHQVFNDEEETLEFLVVCAPPWTPDDFIEA
ncbi:MAG: cupin domain-containing protein [Bryobacteraceae bacterium]